MVLVDLDPALANDQERKVTRFIAAEVARLLRDPSVQYRDKPDSEPRRLKPPDIAILVSANRQAVPLLSALSALRVPAVSGATGDIAESAMFQDVLLLVGAIEDPANPRRYWRARHGRRCRPGRHRCDPDRRHHRQLRPMRNPWE